MDLVNPFEEVVVFGKAYPVAWPVQSASSVAALVPTGRHVGHGNDLTHIRRKRTGGSRTKVERFTKRADPFAKSRGRNARKREAYAAGQVRARNEANPELKAMGDAFHAAQKPPEAKPARPPRESFAKPAQNPLSDEHAQRVVDNVRAQSAKAVRASKLPRRIAIGAGGAALVGGGGYGAYRLARRKEAASKALLPPRPAAVKPAIMKPVKPVASGAASASSSLARRRAPALAGMAPSTGQSGTRIT